MLSCVVAGGQTGVDRGALDAALDLEFPCGGWCPEGRQAEDGVIPARYPLDELTGGYEERTQKNVEDSDGTLVITFGRASGGTVHTIDCCKQLGRPHMILDASALPLEEALREALRFLRNERVARLNVAGPRASGEPRAHGYAYRLVRELCLQAQRSSA
jgi:hypothetical protein